MKLTRNSPAPDFSTVDLFDQPFQLSRLAGRPVLLSFLRYGGCALCNLRVHELIQHYPKLAQLGCAVLVVFESSRESIVTHVSRQQAPFPIIADPEARLYDLYAVETSEKKVMANLGTTPKQQQLMQAAAQLGYGLRREPEDNFFRMPADFLIGPDQVILESFYSDIIGDHLDLNDVIRHLQEPG
jgi:peroxiredoxin